MEVATNGGLGIAPCQTLGGGQAELETRLHWLRSYPAEADSFEPDLPDRKPGSFHMRPHYLFTATLFATLAFGSVASAESFSTSAVSPGQIPASGSIAATYPTGGNETRYYFTADLK